MSQYHALFDFVGEQDGDLSFLVGELITVTNTNVGNGWFEGRDGVGKMGVFPSSYVEISGSGTLPADPPDDDNWSGSTLEKAVTEFTTSLKPPPPGNGNWLGEFGQLSTPVSEIPYDLPQVWDSRRDVVELSANDI